MGSWYVMHTKPRLEMLVASLLEQHWRLLVYLPEVTQQRAGRSHLSPLFPGYLFVQADLGQTPASALNSLPGAIRLVAFDGRPQPVPEAAMARLCQQVEALNAAGGIPNHPFRPGDTVQLASGPLQGLEAVFLGPMRAAQRVRVLLRFLGQLREVEVAVEALEPTPQASVARQRRTRGKGRRIRSAGPAAKPTD